jgi:hypothetical protein
MFADLGRSHPDPEADVIARAVVVPALSALAVIHVVDLPGTLGPDRLVGIGYLGIIAAAVLAGGAMIVHSGWLTWAAAGRPGCRRHGRLRADPGRARGLPRRSRRCRQLALPARHRGTGRGDGDHPAHGRPNLASAAPRHWLLRAPCPPGTHPRIRPLPLRSLATSSAAPGLPTERKEDRSAHPPAPAHETRQPRPRGGIGCCR